MALADAPVVKAAGGILQRFTARGEEVMIVFRTRHQDWVLPKGQVNDGESFEDAALRKVQEETGCSCQLGKYIGSISYSDSGIPRVASFWRMSLVQQTALAAGAEIGEALWLPIAAAIERLTHPQEKALLLRLANASRTYQPPDPAQSSPVGPPAVQPAMETVVQPAPQPSIQPVPQSAIQPAPQSSVQPVPQSSVQPVPQPSLQPAEPPQLQPEPVVERFVTLPPDQLEHQPHQPDAAAIQPEIAVPSPLPHGKKQHDREERAHARLMREFEAFSVELGFLEQRSLPADKSWALAARHQLDTVKRYLESYDIESGWFSLRAAQRYALYGLTRAELLDRACILREEVQRIPSWRAGAIRSLLSVPEDQLTPSRLADAIALRDDYAAHQYQRFWLAGDQLNLLLLICALALLALVPFTMLAGEIRVVASLLLFGLLGAAFGTAQSLMLDRSDSRTPEQANNFVVLSRVLFGAVPSLAGYAFYESRFLTTSSGEHSLGIALAIAVLFGYAGSRLVARVAGATGTHKSQF